MIIRTVLGLTVAIRALAGGVICAQTNAAPAPVPPAKVSVDQLRAKAEKGDAEAQWELARAYHTGAGVPKDEAEAFAWDLKSAQQGYPPAELASGWYYHNGVATAKDEPASLAWYRKAAEQGNAGAQTVVASHYIWGIVVTRDEVAARDWACKAAVQNFTPAQEILAHLLLFGSPAVLDLKKGLAYALVNAGKSPTSANDVAQCYAQGLAVKQDSVYAYAYALRSVRLGPTDWASNLLAQYKGYLTSEQFARATEIAATLEDRAKSRFEPQLTLDRGRETTVRIPFQCVMGMIVISASIGNQSPANFVFDTGACHTYLDSRYASRIGIEGNDYTVQVPFGLEPELVTLSGPTTVSVGNLKWNNVPLFVNPMPIDRELGRPIAGIIGVNLFTQSVVRIDYEHQFLEVTDPAAFNPPGDTGEKFPLTRKFELPFIPALARNGREPSKAELFALDTGNTGTIDFFPDFWKDNSNLRLTHEHGSGAVGYDGILHRDTNGLCSTFEIGATTLEQIPVFTQSSGPGIFAGSCGGIGCEVLRRFTVTLDYPGKRVFLQKNTHWGEPWRFPKAGVHVIATGANYETLQVADIVPDSPGTRAGLQRGDVIMKLDALDHPTVEQIHDAFWADGGHTLQVRRDGKLQTLSLHCGEDPDKGSAKK